MGGPFQYLLTKFGTKDIQSTSKNLQSNSICERMHQTVGNILRVLLHGNPPQTVGHAEDLIDEAHSIASHAMQMTITNTLGSTPGALAFGRDMFLNVPLIAYWQLVASHREQYINNDLCRANQKRRQYD